MKLTEVKFSGMKGQSACQPLTGMDIFIGKNGAGKTTRLQAISYAMLGYVPGQKKTAADVFKMATGDNMNVELSGEVFRFCRTLKKTSRRNSKTGEVTSNIKESITLSPGAGERTDTEKIRRIEEEMGHFNIMLDFGEFLTMSDAKRRDFIYGLSAIEESAWDRNRLHKYLVTSLLTDELQKNNVEQYKALETMITKAIAQYPVGYAISDGLQAMLDWADSERRYWVGKQKDAQGAVRQIAEQKNEIEETEHGIEIQKQTLTALENTLILFEKQASTAAEKVKTIEKRCGRMAELLKEIEKLEADPAVDTAGIEAALTALRNKMKPVPDISADMQALFEKGRSVKAKICTLRQEKSHNDGMVAMIQSTIQSLDDALAQIGKLKGRCIASAAIACPKDFSDPQLIAGIEKNKAAAAAKTSELKAQTAAILSRLHAAEEEEETLSKERAFLEKKVHDTNIENARLNQEITKLTAQKESAARAQAERKSKLDAYREELQRLTCENEAMNALPQDMRDKVQEAAQRAAETRAKIADTKMVIEQKEKARQALILAQQAMVEHLQADYNAIAMKLIFEKLGPKGAQGELVKEILEPIRVDIAVNLQLMGFKEEPFFETESETGKEIFQFGWMNEHGHKVNFDALSAGQQTVFLAAMLVTIIDRKQPKTKLLVMDNLNHLDAQNFQLLIDGLTKVKEKLDNIILAGAIEFEFDPAGWRIWNLTQERGVEQSA